MSKDCDRRMNCKVCGQKHPSVLHISKKEKGHRHRYTTGKSSGQYACGHTGAGSSDGVLSILPVQVKSSKGDKIIQTYAFLDPGSTSTFCCESLMRKLKVSGTRAKIHLHTMAPDQKVPSFILQGLEIAGYDDQQFYELPEVLTQKKMPVSTCSIIPDEELAKWPYLNSIHIPRIQADVDLLIGTNASRLMEPWEVINGYGDGPYAIKTLLGWVINGPLQGSSQEQSGCSVAAGHRIAVDRLEELLIHQYNHDFNEKTSGEQEMSREERKFMDIVSSSVQL